MGGNGIVRFAEGETRVNFGCPVGFAVVADAVVIGAGPNGLVAANVLCDHGWSVEVLEAADEPGGAVRSAELTAPGFVTDRFSSFYPLGFASPALGSLDLGAYGLRWVRAPAVLAHPLPDGRAAVVEDDPVATAEGLDLLSGGDGAAWLRLQGLWDRVGGELVETVLSPVPPVRAVAALARAGGAQGLAELARLVLQSARDLVEERFAGEAARLLFTGASQHADVAPESAGSALFGFLLCGAGQDVGYPVPRGGAGALTAALVARLRAGGGLVHCGRGVTQIEVSGGRAVAVRTEQGDVVAAGRAVLADVDVVSLYRRLVPAEHLPDGLGDRMARSMARGPATFKLDWALSSPIPWLASAAARAGTVHLAPSTAALTISAAEIAAGLVPSEPFLLVGQMTTTDPTRSPPGTEAAWAYTHVPHRILGDRGGELTGRWDGAEVSAMVRRIEEVVERHAPGFSQRIVARHVQSPPSMEAADANLVGGDLSGGSAALHQQLVLRPTVGLARPETPVRGLYLASASAHPGNAVHGAPGANAAYAALGEHRPWSRPVQWATGSLARRLARAALG